MSNNNGATPTFDFSNVSRGWQKRWMRSVTRSTELQITLEDLQDEGGEVEKETARRLLAAMQEMESISDVQAELVAKVLVDVPRSWLEKDAPEEIDWKDPDSLDWVLGEKYPLIVQELQTLRQGNSKN